MGEQQNYPPVLLSFSLHSKCLLNQQPAYLLVNGLGTFLLVDEPICLFGDFALICLARLIMVSDQVELKDFYLLFDSGGIYSTLLVYVSRKGEGLTYVCRCKLVHNYFSIFVLIRSAKRICLW